MHVVRSPVALLLPVALAFAAAPVQGQATRDLSGRWALRDRDAVEEETAAAPQPERRESPPSPLEDGRPPRRQPRGGLRDEDRLQIGRLLGMAQVVPAFELRQNDTALVVRNEDGFTYTVPLDGRQSAFVVADSLRVETRAKWDDGHLVVEFRPEGGGKLTERYALADSRLFLRLEVTVEHDRLPRRVWRSRMYRRVDEPEP